MAVTYRDPGDGSMRVMEPDKPNQRGRNNRFPGGPTTDIKAWLTDRSTKPRRAQGASKGALLSAIGDEFCHGASYLKVAPESSKLSNETTATLVGLFDCLLQLFDQAID